MFYHNANPMEVTRPEALGFFSSFSIGNIAVSKVSCDSMNIAIDDTIALKCPSGKLENIMYYGFSKEDDATCMSIRSAVKPESFFEQKCYK